MLQITRRDYVKGTLAAMAGAMVPTSQSLAAASGEQPSKPAASSGGKIVLCELTGPGRLATTMLQMGLTHVIAGMGLRGTVEQQAEQVTKKEPPQKNLWVKWGSGSAPRL